MQCSNCNKPITIFAYITTPLLNNNTYCLNCWQHIEDLYDSTVNEHIRNGANNA